MTGATGVTHDICLDPDGENLLLTLEPGGWQMRQALPFAAKPGTAKPERSFADLTDWSVWEQINWAHGALQEDFEDDGMYFWGNIDSRFNRQLILPPRRMAEPVGSAGEAYFWQTGNVVRQTISTATTQRFAQQFECAAETVCNKVYVPASRDNPAYLTVTLHTDNAGVPGTAVRVKTVTATPDYHFLRVNWNTPYTLLAGTKYWLSYFLNASSSGTVRLGYDPDAGYGDGLAKQSTDSGGSWSAFTGDFFFVIENGWGASSLVTGPFAVFKTDEYVISGAKVYKHDDANNNWDDAGAGLSATGTDIAVYNSWIYVAQDAGQSIRKSTNASAWGNIGSADEARCFCIHGGMLYRARANLVYYSSDPHVATPSWSAAITVGTSEYKVLTMVSTQWGVIALKEDGGWLVPGRPGQEDRAYRIDALNWSTKPIDNTGVLGIPAVVWSDGMLYIAERSGLLRWDGEVATPVGLDLGTGLSSPYTGNITGLLRHTNFMYASIGAGDDTDDNQSSLWAYNGGWHKLLDVVAKGRNLAAIGYTTQHSPHRLMMAVRKRTACIFMPDTTDNPAQYASPTYAGWGHLVSSAFAAGLPNADKAFLSVGVHVERATDTQVVHVYYRVDCDDDDAWWHLGKITQDGLNEYDLPVASFTKRQVNAACSRTVLTLTSTTGLSVGDWVCINQLYGQIKSIIADTSITLYYPLSAAPSASDWLYPGVPVGKKVWYQLVLASEDVTKTPVVKGVYFKYRVLLKDKRVWRVVAKLAPGAPLLTGQPSGVTVSDTRAALWRLAKRAHIDCLPPDYRTTGEKISVIISDYSEFMVVDRLVEGGGRPEHTYQVTLSLLEV